MLGSETYLYLVINGINFTARVHPKSTTKPGDKIKIAFDMSTMHLFDKETEKTIVN
jgi:multiple sugar transport system ATP-binding protein